MIKVSVSLQSPLFFLELHVSAFDILNKNDGVYPPVNGIFEREKSENHFTNFFYNVFD